MSQIQWIALIIFTITYIGIIFTRLPWVNIDRPSAAFFGAVAMVCFGVLDFDEAIYSIDFNTIMLLLGMMIMISCLQLDGFFNLIAEQTLKYAKTPLKLLIFIVFITGFASAFLVNDAVVLIFTPIIIHICLTTNLPTIPFLIGEILASNAGSVMTITGNPQNMLIGINAGISFAKFLGYLFPVAFIGMIISIIIVFLIYKKQVNWKLPIDKAIERPTYQIRDMRYSLLVFILVIIAFFIGKQWHISIPLIALTGASLILLFGKEKPSKIIKQVDWVLLLFFAALFIVVHGIEKVGLMEYLLNALKITANSEGIGVIHVLSLVLSQIVSNVPLTIVLLPLMKTANSEILWMSLASATTLAGNATIIGAMANLIVIENAKIRNIEIKFFEFLKPGLLVTIISMLFSFGYFYLVNQLI